MWPTRVQPAREAADAAINRLLPEAAAAAVTGHQDLPSELCPREAAGFRWLPGLGTLGFVLEGHCRPPAARVRLGRLVTVLW
jgi:hypothetical protein